MILKFRQNCHTQSRMVFPRLEIIKSEPQTGRLEQSIAQKKICRPENRAFNIQVEPDFSGFEQGKIFTKFYRYH